MPKGRPRKPDELKRLEGNRGRRDLNRAAPKPGTPAERPKRLAGYAAGVWDRIVSSMPPGLYGACDEELLAAYCVAADLHRQALEGVEKEGVIAVAKNGAPYLNAWVTVLNKQALLLASLGGRLGLDPAARSSIAMPPTEEPDEFGDLIGIPGGRKG